MSTHVTIARGKTFDLRDLLKQHGFTWNDEKRWWVLDPAMDEADRFTLVKSIRRAGLADQVEVKNIKREWA